MDITNPTYTKENALEAEKLVDQAKSLTVLSGMMSVLYDFLNRCFVYGDTASAKRMYFIIVKAQKKFDTMAKEQKFETWDGN